MFSRATLPSKQLPLPETVVDTRFTTHVLVAGLFGFVRRSPKVAEVLPVLYLRGLSTGDFRDALAALLGDDAAGLSATNIARLTNEWETEYHAFQKRSLADRDYVYVWVDGVHFFRGQPVERAARSRRNSVATSGKPPPIAQLRCVPNRTIHAECRLVLRSRRRPAARSEPIRPGCQRDRPG